MIRVLCMLLFFLRNDANFSQHIFEFACIFINMEGKEKYIVQIFINAL